MWITAARPALAPAPAPGTRRGMRRVARLAALRGSRPGKPHGKPPHSATQSHSSACVVPIATMSRHSCPSRGSGCRERRHRLLAPRRLTWTEGCVLRPTGLDRWSGLFHGRDDAVCSEHSKHHEHIRARSSTFWSPIRLSWRWPGNCSRWRRCHYWYWYWSDQRPSR